MSRETPKMITSRTSVKTNKSEKESRRENSSQRGQQQQKVSKLFPSSNSFSDFGSGFVAISGSAREQKKRTATKRESSSKERSEKSNGVEGKSSKRAVLCEAKQKHEIQGRKAADDRDFRRLKSKYNNGVGNILREWVNLVYCILILRMNLIKFIIEKFPDFGANDVQLQEQIVLESRIIYKIIRKAQHYSQEQFLYMWSHLDKLILNRLILRNALESIKMKDSGVRDWKAASEKLSTLQSELEKAQSACKAIQKSKIQFEMLAKEKLAKLESLTNSKNSELEHLVHQIGELKNSEIQMRGKILLNVKSYKELKSKKQILMNLEKEMSRLKGEQSALMKDYAMKIQTLKNQVETKEREIKLEKEEKQKIKATLVGLGDFSETRSLIKLHES